MKNVYYFCQQTTLYTHYHILHKNVYFYKQVKQMVILPITDHFFIYPLPPHTYIIYIYIHTHKFTNYSMKFGTLWLHQNITHWTAFSFDFPVTQ
jgi:hypothetical protein